MIRNILRVLWFVVCLCVMLAGNVSYAQSGAINNDLISGYGLRNLQNAVIIVANPATPNAGDTVHLTAEASVFNLPKDTITWTVNGKTISRDTGATSIDTTVDTRGDPLDVVVSVSDPVWGSASNELQIVPLQVDILYDAPTYVPPFYRGRALPSAGGSMRLQAVARLVENGSLVPNSSIVYTWSRNGRVLGSVSGRGKSSATIDAPSMYGTDSVSVRASSADDAVSAAASVTVPNTPPIVELYEDHPLYGITYFNALQGTVPEPGETAVAAVPYFATVTDLSDPSLEYTWLLNGSALTASTTVRNEVTIEPSKQSEKLHLDLASAANFFLSAAADWAFDFGSSGGSSLQQPGSSDAFHNSNL